MLPHVHSNNHVFKSVAAPPFYKANKNIVAKLWLRQCAYDWAAFVHCTTFFMSLEFCRNIPIKYAAYRPHRRLMTKLYSPVAMEDS